MTKDSTQSLSQVESAIKSCYSTWGMTYFDDYYGENAAYPPIHLDLVRRLIDEAAPSRLLDAGCGPASMLRMLATPERTVFGFDLTPEMTAEARRVMSTLGVPDQNIWEGSVLEGRDYAPAGIAAATYDAIVCCGVLPHIPAEMDDTVIRNIHDALNPSGIAIVGARNELFSLFTLNRYTHEFFHRQLLPIDMMRVKAGPESGGLDAALAELENMFRIDLPPVRNGKAGEPGYDEVLSRSHNPLLLQGRFLANGFRDVRLMYYHFHCLPPVVARHAPGLFKAASIEMEKDPEDWRGMLMASAFFVVARRS